MTRQHPFHDDIVLLYDAAILAKEDDAVPYADIRNELVPRVAELLDKIPRDRLGEAGRLIDAVIKPVKEKRRQTIKDQLRYLLDSLFISGDDGANIDPLMDTAYPLGQPKGEAKALRYWTVEDFRNLVLTAYRNVAEVNAAARALDEVVQHVIEVMVAQDADILGDIKSNTEPDDSA